MTISLIWAQADGGVIGADGALPWHLPEDLKLFRTLTWGSTVVMGRKTWESLPAAFRPLPGRENVVLSRAPGFEAEGAAVAHSVAEVLEATTDAWVIGGAGVFAAFLPYAERVVRTEVDLDVVGDVVAPTLGPEWQLEQYEPLDGWATSTTGLRYRVGEFTATR